MAKGIKTGGRRKGTPNKATADVREAIAKIAERNISVFEGWLARVAKDDPARAAEIYLKMIEYHIPKLERAEITGANSGPILLSDFLKTLG